MPVHTRLHCLTFLFMGALCSSSAVAAARVDLVVVADRNAPLVAEQTWARELGQAGVRNVQFRRGRSTDRPAVEVRGATDSPRYVVTGVLDARGELSLPGGRYRAGQSRQIAAWLDELARRGPPESREPAVAFGLSRSQMAAVREALAVPVDFSTRGQSRAAVVRKLVEGLELPVQMDRKLLGTDQEDRVADELSGLSRGTALAAVLRPAGLALVPQPSSTGPECRILTARGQRETWPVGWKPDERPARVLPKYLESAVIHLENVPISEVLEAVGRRVEAPVLVDYAAVARRGVALDKRVKIPQTRMSYADALDRALFQAMLKCELRTDEAGRPFLWVTTLKQ
ncbi:MAG: hypothetical protein JW719_08795 [Pirellulales bacterium]|nr:hypothetical protein [Pirellulales bacterium]